MTTINVQIIINEEHIRVRALKAYQAAKKAAYKHFNQACQWADEIGSRKGTQAVLSGVSSVLGNKPTQWPLHTIFCECRRCRPLNIRTYCKRIMNT